MTQLSPHFSLAEMTRSETAARRGLRNVPPSAMLPRLVETAQEMERVRAICGNRPIQVFSAYRSDAVNKLVGGSPTSDHRNCEAVDFKVVGLSIGETVALLRADKSLIFDQLIDEFSSWVHIGFGGRKRRQVLAARKQGGKTVYKVA